MAQEREPDIVEMPVEGLAAYWLSVKKILDAKKGIKFIEDEAEHTSEPFIKHLLTIGFSQLPAELIRSLARAKRDTLLTDRRRKLDLMRLGVLGAAGKENPRLTFVRMLSLFPAPPISESQAFDLAQGLMDGLDDPAADKEVLLAIHHQLAPDRLVAKLMFYALKARREGPGSLADFLKYACSPFFREGLSMAVDNMDPAFIRKQLEALQSAIMTETEAKMDMSIEMCLGIRIKLTYDQIHTIARSYMA